MDNNRQKRSFEDAFGEDFGATFGALAFELKKAREEITGLKELLRTHVVKPNQLARNKHNLANQDWAHWEPTDELSAKQVKALLVKRKSSYASEPEGGVMRAALAEVRETECAICCEAFNRESIVVTHGCGHMFHLNCINTQLMALEDNDQLACPTCRCPVK